MPLLMMDFLVILLRMAFLAFLIAYKVCNGLVEKLSTSAEPKQLNDNENGSNRDVPTHIYGATPNCVLI